MPTGAATPWGVGVLAVRSARAWGAVVPCPSMFTAVLNSRKFFRRKPFRASSMDYNNEAPMKRS
jgi:hypothetical protein